MIKSLAPHEVKCLKNIAEFVEGKKYSVSFQAMTGRQYKHGTHIVNGKQEWIDKEGKPEDRIMVLGLNAFCARPKEVLDQHFETI